MGKPIELRARHPQIINGYGPTENTTFTTTYAIPPKLPARIPIGSPINGTTVYVIQGQRLCGVGVPGELCIGGSGLAKGYLNQPEQTQQSFVKSPLNGEAIYKSGDLVRLQEDGNIDYISRIDKQVKIRGFRIELSEIEKQSKRYAILIKLSSLCMNMSKIVINKLWHIMRLLNHNQQAH